MKYRATINRSYLVACHKTIYQSDVESIVAKPNVPRRDFVNAGCQDRSGTDNVPFECRVRLVNHFLHFRYTFLRYFPHQAHRSLVSSTPEDEWLNAPTFQRFVDVHGLADDTDAPDDSKWGSKKPPRRRSTSHHVST